MLETRIIDDFDALKEVSAEWHALAEHCARTPFQTPQWNLAWWRIVGTWDPSLSLHALAFSLQGSMCGIAPLMIRTAGAAKTLTFISEPFADYHDVIVDSSAVDPQQVFSMLLEHIYQGLGECWDSVELKDLPAGSGFQEYLTKMAGQDSRIRLEAGLECPRLQIDDEGAFAIAANKKEYAFKQRRLARMGELVCRHYTEPQDIASRMPSYMQMHLRQWLPRPNCGITFDDPTIVRFYDQSVAALAPHRLLMLTELMLNDRPIAYYYGFTYKQVYWAYRPAFETEMAKYSPGGVMHRFMFLEFKKQRFAAFDFMRGSTSYKYRFANVRPRNTDATIEEGR